MQRVKRSTAVVTMPAAPVGGTPGFFTGGNPGTGTPASVPGYEWFNGVQEELIGLILRGGITASDGDLAQVRKSLDRLFGGGLASLSANTTLTVDDAGLVLVNASGGARTITLPAANALGGRPIRFTIARSDASANTVTVQPAGADTIEGATATLIPIGQPLSVMSDGVSGWRIVSRVGLNSVYVEYTANADLTAAIPIDDTIPQISEGTQVISAAITPRSAASRIRAEFRAQGGTNSAGASGFSAALFLNGASNAVRASTVTVPGNGNMTDLSLSYEFQVASIAQQTLAVRVGPQNGSMRLNGASGGRYFGGALGATLVLTEVC